MNSASPRITPTRPNRPSQAETIPWCSLNQNLAAWVLGTVLFRAGNTMSLFFTLSLEEGFLTIHCPAEQESLCGDTGMAVGVCVTHCQNSQQETGV